MNGRCAMGSRLVVALVLSCGAITHGAETVYPHGAVAADHPLASAAGVAILQRGGNVIDAAVATAMALSVVRPESSGLGGGGFLLHWDASAKTATAWDYRERAPLAATPDMYTSSKQGETKRSSVHGIFAVAVPGQIPGLCEIHRRHGKLPLAEVLEPAIRLATEGVQVDEFALGTQQSLIRRFQSNVTLQTDYAPLWNRYLNAGVKWKADDRFFSPQLPALKWLAELGPDAYTSGPIGTALVDFSREQGGLLTTADLEQMTPVPRQALRGQFGDYEILTMPPPSSGGLAILQTLQILTAWEAIDGHVPWKSLPTSERVHVLVEALKHVFADRARHLGDRDFVAVPVERLLSAEHAEDLAQRIVLDKTFPSSDYGLLQLPDDAGTTHFCVMDGAGNAVACTETINTTFGSYVVEPRTGIVLNNEMDDFTAIPGEANAFGLQQSAANLIAPRKKPLSSMSPTLVLKEGRVVAIAGASGGPKIITATLQVLLQMLVWETSATAAVSAPRLHHQWTPDEVQLEREYEGIDAALSGRGHQIKRVSSLAATQALRVTPQGLEPASDPRKHGRPAGY